MYYYSNYNNTSIIVSQMLSLISLILPSISTMGSTCVCLSDFYFFCCPPFCSCECFFKMKGVVCSSLPPPPCYENSCSLVWWEVEFSLSFVSFYSCYAYTLATQSSSIRAFLVATLATSIFFCSVKVHTTF